MQNGSPRSTLARHSPVRWPSGPFARPSASARKPMTCVITIALALLLHGGTSAQHPDRGTSRPGSPAHAEEPAWTTTVSPASLDPRKWTASGLYLTSREAHSLVARGQVVLLDVREPSEVSSVGAPTVLARNIPYMLLDIPIELDHARGAYKLGVNPDFVRGVEKLLEEHKLGKDAPLALICRSGDRSAKAADRLAREGFTRVHSVVDGFEGDLDRNGRRTIEGWRNAGLPWSYRLTPEQAWRNPAW